MKRCFSLLLFSLLPHVGWGAPADPNNAGSNPYVDAQSVFLKPHSPPADPLVKVRFSTAIDKVEAAKVANYSLRQTSPELGAGTPGGTLEDLDGDGDLDMVLAIKNQIVAYKNEGTRSTPRYSSPPIVLATVGYYDGLVLVEKKPSNVVVLGEEIWTKNVTFGDLDNDGDRDMICSESADGQVTCFRRQNNGSMWPVFGPQERVVQYPGPIGILIEVSAEENGFHEDVSIASVAAEDINGDGFVDLVVGDPSAMWSQPQNIQVYCGTGEVDSGGSCIFNPPVALKAAGNPITLEWTIGNGAICPAFHDIDGDGDRDMIVSTTGGEVWFFKANGRDLNPASVSYGFPIFGAGERLKDVNGVEVDFGNVSALSICDYSGDGDMDLVMVSTGGLLEDNRFRLLENVGGGGLRFSGRPLPIGVGGLEIELRTSQYSRSTYFDFDGDGHIDVLYAGSGYGLAISYNLDTGNTPHPRFSVPAVLPLSAGVVSLLADGVPDIVDFDGDGLLDVNVDGILVGTKTDLVFMKYQGAASDGLPEFGAPISVLPPGFPTLHFIQPTVGDLNGDGKLDVVLGSGTMYSGENANLQVLINGAAEQFQLASPVNLTVGGSTAQFSKFPELVDFDGDGDCDLLVSSPWAAIRFLKNSGSPVSGWVDQGLVQDTSGNSVLGSGGPLVMSGGASPRVVDFNGDGKPDLLVSAANSAVTPFLGAGSGPGISVSPASPTLKAVATLPSSALLTEGDKTLELAFPMIVHVGNHVDLNELSVGGNRCAILMQEIKPDTTLVDSDQDGLPDDWEIQHFGSIAAYDGDDDPDNDGLGNKEESELGLDPNVNEPAVSPGRNGGYSYDDVGRLTDVTGPVAPATFTPDEEGNILNAQ